MTFRRMPENTTPGQRKSSRLTVESMVYRKFRVFVLSCFRDPSRIPR